MEQLKEKLLAKIREYAAQAFDLSDAMAREPEIGLEEVKPHTTKVACFLLPPCGGCPLEASDCLPTFTVFAQITHAAA